MPGSPNPEGRVYEFEEGYGVTVDGRVWSRFAPGINKPVCCWKEMAYSVDRKWGYLSVDLRGDVSRKKRRVSVHRMVYESIVGKIPEGLQINHIDGDKTNNSISNLEVVTGSENIKHAFRNGLMVAKRGASSGASKLRESEVDIIRLWYSGFGMNPNQISSRITVSDSAIRNICYGKSW